jgi:hypothetical protein
MPAVDSSTPVAEGWRCVEELPPARRQRVYWPGVDEVHRLNFMAKGSTVLHGVVVKLVRHLIRLFRVLA